MDTQQHALTSLTAPQTPAPVWYWCCSTTLPPGWSSSAMLTHTGTPMASAACTKLAQPAAQNKWRRFHGSICAGPGVHP